MNDEQQARECCELRHYEYYRYPRHECWISVDPVDYEIKREEKMANDSSKLIKIGNNDVKSALGFFWHDRHKIYVAATPEDIGMWKKRGYEDSMLYPMSDLERAFRDSMSLRFISWCDVKRGCLVRQGAKQVTFEYVDSKVVIHLK